MHEKTYTTGMELNHYWKIVFDKHCYNITDGILRTTKDHKMANGNSSEEAYTHISFRNAILFALLLFNMHIYKTLLVFPNLTRPYSWFPSKTAQSPSRSISLFALLYLMPSRIPDQKKETEKKTVCHVVIIDTNIVFDGLHITHWSMVANRRIQKCEHIRGGRYSALGRSGHHRINKINNNKRNLSLHVGVEFVSYAIIKWTTESGSY